MWFSSTGIYSTPRRNQANKSDTNQDAKPSIARPAYRLNFSDLLALTISTTRDDKQKKAATNNTYKKLKIKTCRRCNTYYYIIYLRIYHSRI